MTFAGYETVSGIPEAHSPGPNHPSGTLVEVAVASFGSSIGEADADLGTVSFKTSDDFTAGSVRLLEARIRRNGRFEFLTEPIALQFAVQEGTKGDFDGDGHVRFSDFILFAGKYGLSRAQAGYEARFDLDGNGRIGFEDFIIFAGVYGK